MDGRIVWEQPLNSCLGMAQCRRPVKLYDRNFSIQIALVLSGR